jgi:hypothetical protein
MVFFLIVSKGILLQRRVAARAHPLTGALNRRMALFSDLAGHNGKAERPPRRHESVDTYRQMQDDGQVV